MGFPLSPVAREGVPGRADGLYRALWTSGEAASKLAAWRAVNATQEGQGSIS